MTKNNAPSPAPHAGKCILITGAGGYLGSALAFALADAHANDHPSLLLLLDNSEHNLHELTLNLRERSAINFLGVLGDVCDEALLAELLQRHRPHAIFHAAACKHVPLMETNPLAAMRTNAIGTWRLVSAAKKNAVSQLLLVSTDKAVNPASVMGATKRVAELALARLSSDAITLQTVRLGNVLGSPGSVAPRFARQIARGGPVTVTDPGAERYFLTLPTAVEIVQRVARLGPGIFIPKLAPAVRIAALAERMIQEARKSGSPAIAVKFTGMRPGDKLREEFLSDGEISEPTPDDRVLRVHGPKIDDAVLDAAMFRLEDAVARRDSPEAMQILRQLVPQYRPSDTVLQVLHAAGVAKNVKRKIAVVTTSRADYSHLYWPLKELQQHPAVQLELIALGAHLSPEFGATINEIEKDGFPIAAKIECLLSSDTDVGMAKTIGVATLSLADTLGQMRPDILLLIADRYEMLAPASVALALRIPLAHIEGGEISEGAIDDAVRNALTKFSHIHFTSTETARRRIIAMDEEAWRVHRAGAPSLDHLRRSTLLNRAELEARLAISLHPPTTVVSCHPVTIVKNTVQEADAVFAALQRLDGQLLFCYPNADAGSRELIDRTRAFVAERENSHVFINLDAVTYWSLLRQADLFLGNSSSGIMETPSLALPAVNIGLRQQGRERARNIIDAPADAAAILSAVARARSDSFRASLAGMSNPYGEGRAAEKIVEVLTTVPLTPDLLLKRHHAG